MLILLSSFALFLDYDMRREQSSVLHISGPLCYRDLAFILTNPFEKVKQTWERTKHSSYEKHN